MPNKARLKCYFGCTNDGPLHHFPNPRSFHTFDIEKFSMWKSVLDVSTQNKGDIYIYDHIRLCNNHFLSCYQLPSGRLTKNAVATLNLCNAIESLEVPRQLHHDDQPSTSGINTTAHTGPLHHFPRFRNDKERFNVWKAMLNNDIKAKGDMYIYNQLRLCNRHFENYYIYHQVTG